MTQNQTSQNSQISQAASKRSLSVYQIAITALMAAVCCILGPISVPIGTIPVTLGVLAVYLCVFVLGAKLGTLACLIYLLLGAVGLPVFASGLCKRPVY